MRTIAGDLEEDQAESQFCDDVELGVLVACGSCGHKTLLFSSFSDERAYCSNVECWKELIYRPWWSW